MRIFGVILFIKLQNDTDFNGEKRKRGKRRRKKERGKMRREIIHLCSFGVSYARCL